ncbi:23S rRNA pseudouridine(2604) synthase RluF [Paenibacillus psychroresistens]|uniref:Pseudouridine synthase n=1 Tax=Paenibacillus psychroresistens TaxID=1778678 RepID=A0A6B8RVY2_9BACL|nr:23S rRNA pseudouridine(2604) synthase RluF [Paenibacillus psychroresistens]QGQ99376.1 23S rRNA pseudouridine(2604) synthase RluF [Paenibacillus psychroresistens]
MRINKFISETGISSRREADKWVEAGRVTINGKLAELGSQAEKEDEVRVDGQLIGAKKTALYIAFNKPVGITCTTERHIEGNIIDFIGHEERIFPIGRLDKDSEGLILLTNNGDIVNQILRAENSHAKEYIVTVNRLITPQFLQGMAEGVPILDTVTQACEVSRISDYVFRIVLTQGLNRQIRRMCAHFEYQVRRLQRVRIMNITLENLRMGSWRELSEAELGQIYEDIAKK